MVVDSSAIVAILFNEPDAERYVRVMADAAHAVISAMSYVELGMIGASRRGLTRADIDRRLAAGNIAVAPVGEAQAHRAFEAFLRYGKGRHPARLNLGDCFAYALAKEHGEPLLFKGEDFAQTDVESAL
jgi:ribonuclease VapC